MTLCCHLHPRPYMHVCMQDATEPNKNSGACTARHFRCAPHSNANLVLHVAPLARAALAAPSSCDVSKFTNVCQPLCPHPVLQHLVCKSSSSVPSTSTVSHFCAIANDPQHLHDICQTASQEFVELYGVTGECCRPPE